MRCLRLLLLLACASLGAAGSLHAQGFNTRAFYNYNSTPLRYFFDLTWTSGLEVKFSNLGTQDFVQNLEEDPTLPTYLFDDGYINVNPPGSTLTSDFGFEYENAQTGPSGYVESFNLTRFGAESRGATATATPEVPMGIGTGIQWLGFKWGERARFGFAGGFSLQNLKSEHTGTFEADFFQQTAVVRLTGSQISPQTTGRYVGSSSGPAIDLVNGFDFDPSVREPVTQVVPGQGTVDLPAEVTGTYKTQGIAMPLRAGVLAESYLTSYLWVQFGGGYSATMVFNEFSMNQVISNSTLSRPVEVTGKTEDTEWFMAPYVEFRAALMINQRARLYFGAVYRLLEDSFDQNVFGVVSSVEFNNPLTIEFGINLNW